MNVRLSKNYHLEISNWGCQYVFSSSMIDSGRSVRGKQSMKKVIAGTLVLFSIFFLAACGASIEKEKVKAEDRAEKAFNADPEAANEEVQVLHFYLPTDMSVKSDKPNNIILEKKDHPYIFFYNQNEPNNSQALYDNMVNEEEGAFIVNKTFSDQNRFGYLMITGIDEETFEVTAGIGGMKVTTESKTKNVSDDAETMMKIVASASLKE